jgi:hypothetical protein
MAGGDRSPRAGNAFGFPGKPALSVGLALDDGFGNGGRLYHSRNIGYCRAVL